MKSEDEQVAADDGTPITKEMLDKWDEAYSSGRIPQGYERDGEAHVGSPPLIEGGASTTPEGSYHRNRKVSMEELCAGWEGAKVGEEWGGRDVGAEAAT